MDASRVYQYCQEAASDFAQSAVEGSTDCYDKKIKELKRAGVDSRYMAEALADHIYEDQDFLVDFIADYTYGTINREDVLNDLSTFGSSFALAVKTITSR